MAKNEKSVKAIRRILRVKDHCTYKCMIENAYEL